MMVSAMKTQGRIRSPRRRGGATRGSALLIAASCGLWTWVPAAAQTPGDVEPNAVVDLRDLIQIRNALGQAGAPGFIGEDVDDSGIVDDMDVLIWRQNYLGPLTVPFLFIAAPVDGALLGDRRPMILIDYRVTSLNVDVETLRVIVDGVDRSADVIKSPRNAVLMPTDALSDGMHFVEASIEDFAGTVAAVRSDFEVTSLTLRPKADLQAPRLIGIDMSQYWVPDGPCTSGTGTPVGNR